MRKSIIFSFLLFLTLVCNAQTDGLSVQLDKIIQKYYNSKEFMGSVLVAQNGNLLLDKAYGYSDIDKRTPNTTTTPYFIASITKLFTLDAIRMLADSGLISIDAPISRYINYFPNGDKILVKHLLQNKSGIVDWINDIPYKPFKEEVSIEELIELFKDLPLKFEPGEKYSYSNSGWVLLAEIIQRVSGLSYSEFIYKNIFEKASMNQSHADWDSIPENMATGYYKDNDVYVQAEYFHPSQAIGAGNIISTTGDLYNWYQNIYLNKDCSTYQWRWNGHHHGYRATMFLKPSIGSVYILLSNFGRAPLDEIVDEIDKAVLENQRFTYDKNIINSYLGAYISNFEHLIIADTPSDNLIFNTIDNSNVSHYECIPMSNNYFVRPSNRIDHSNAYFKFEQTDNTELIKLKSTWSCNSYYYQKCNFKMNNQVINSITGNYLINDTTYFTIEFKQSKGLEIRLVTNLTDIKFYDLYEISDNILVFSNGKLIFKNDNNEINYNQADFMYNNNIYKSKRVINNNAP